MDREALAGLLERVRAATGADRELDWDLCILLAMDMAVPDGPAGWKAAPFYTASVDAALALVERVLPDVSVSVASYPTSTGRSGACEMWRWAANKFDEARERNKANGYEHMHQNVGAATPPLAVLTATLTALLAQESK